jgi:hypothetical protein
MYRGQERYVHEACSEDRRVTYRVLVWRPDKKNQLEDPGIGGMTILK